jgi:hypothetical protein
MSSARPTLDEPLARRAGIALAVAGLLLQSAAVTAISVLSGGDRVVGIVLWLVTFAVAVDCLRGANPLPRIAILPTTSVAACLVALENAPPPLVALVSMTLSANIVALVVLTLRTPGQPTTGVSRISLAGAPPGPKRNPTFALYAMSIVLGTAFGLSGGGSMGAVQIGALSLCLALAWFHESLLPTVDAGFDLRAAPASPVRAATTAFVAGSAVTTALAFYLRAT